jgi:hypothetical protein
LFHGLEGTNQGIHQRQPGTVLSTGFSHQSGKVLSFGDRPRMLTARAAVKSWLALLKAESPMRGTLSTFSLPGVSAKRSWEFYPGALNKFLNLLPSA